MVTMALCNETREVVTVKVHVGKRLLVASVYIKPNVMWGIDNEWISDLHAQVEHTIRCSSLEILMHHTVPGVMPIITREAKTSWPWCRTFNSMYSTSIK